MQANSEKFRCCYLLRTPPRTPTFATDLPGANGAASETCHQCRSCGNRSESGACARRLRGYFPLRSNGFTHTTNCANPPIADWRVDWARQAPPLFMGVVVVPLKELKFPLS